jgi:hypothetical protein
VAARPDRRRRRPRRPRASSTTDRPGGTTAQARGRCGRRSTMPRGVAAATAARRWGVPRMGFRETRRYRAAPSRPRPLPSRSGPVAKPGRRASMREPGSIRTRARRRRAPPRARVRAAHRQCLAPQPRRRQLPQARGRSSPCHLSSRLLSRCADRTGALFLEPNARFQRTAVVQARLTKSHNSKNVSPAYAWRHCRIDRIRTTDIFLQYRELTR